MWHGDIQNSTRKTTIVLAGVIARKHNLACVMIHHNVKKSEFSAPDKNKVNGSEGFEYKLGPTTICNKSA